MCIRDRPRPWWLTDQAAGLWSDYTNEVAALQEAIDQRMGAPLEDFADVEQRHAGEGDNSTPLIADNTESALTASFDISDAGPGVIFKAFQDDRGEGRIEVAFVTTSELPTADIESLNPDIPVSYTHLTLPTKA